MLRIATALVVLIAAGCATGAFVRPAGPSVPFPEAGDIWSDMTRRCVDLSSYRAQLRVSGRVDGERVPGLMVGVAIDNEQIAMEARYGAARVFTLGGHAENVTLLLDRDARVVRGSAADIVEALVGIPMAPSRLRELLTGCLAPADELSDAARIGSVARLTAADVAVYLRLRSGIWQLIAGEFDGVVADYRRVDADGPREIVLRRPAETTLTLQVIEFERNPQLGPGLFRPVVPESFVETSLETLRATGLVGRRP